MLSSCSDPPNQPLRPYTKISARPAMTGDTDTGRSIKEFSTLRPGNWYRVSSRAVVKPKTVLIKIASAVTRRDRVIAATASGEVIESTNSPRPSSKVRPTMTASGSTTRTVTYRIAIRRRAHRVVACCARLASPAIVRTSATASRPSLDNTKQDDHDQGDKQQNRRHRRRPGKVVVLDLTKHPGRCHFGAPGKTAGDQDD